LIPHVVFMVINVMSRKLPGQDELKRKILYADYLAVMADDKEELHKALQ